jgi:predicted nucleic acid-binding protein
MLNNSFVLDTNIIIDFLEKKDATLPKGERFFSVITEMELFSSPALTQNNEIERRNFLSKMIVVPFKDVIKNEAIRIRRFGSPCLKLPDAIIAATAVVLNATLVTSDETMLRLNWPGFTVCNAKCES